MFTAGQPPRAPPIPLGGVVLVAVIVAEIAAVAVLRLIGTPAVTWTTRLTALVGGDHASAEIVVISAVIQLIAAEFGVAVVLAVAVIAGLIAAVAG